MTSPAPAVDQIGMQGNYAGSVSRLVAYGIDLGIVSALFALALMVISFAAKVVTGQSINWNRGSIALGAIFLIWELTYLGYSWAASGRSPGMAVLGVRVVRQDGAPLDRRRAVVRALAFPLSFLLFGLGLVGIVVQREHRALHDFIAGTAVVYSWDARAARLRSLAHAHAAQDPAGPRPTS
jgi:uncharacterized RDD family membrane protein YckC